MTNAASIAGKLRSAEQLVDRANTVMKAGLMVLFAIVVAGALVRAGAEWLGEHAGPGLAFAYVVACALLWFALESLIKHQGKRNRAGNTESVTIVAFIVGAALMWIYIFAGLSLTMMKLGFFTYEFTGASAAQVEQLKDAYLWHLLDLIPALDIDKALQWTAPVDLEGGRRGLLVVLFRAVMIFQVFKLWGHMKRTAEPLDEDQQIVRSALSAVRARRAPR